MASSISSRSGHVGRGKLGPTQEGLGCPDVRHENLHIPSYLKWSYDIPSYANMPWDIQVLVNLFQKNEIISTCLVISLFVSV